MFHRALMIKCVHYFTNEVQLTHASSWHSELGVLIIILKVQTIKLYENKETKAEIASIEQFLLSPNRIDKLSCMFIISFQLFIGIIDTACLWPLTNKRNMAKRNEKYNTSSVMTYNV